MAGTFDSFIIGPTVVGSFLNSQFPNSSIQNMTSVIDGTGSVIIIVER